MRIIAGSLKGLKLYHHRGRGANSILRATTGKVRENIFNLLINGQFGNQIEDSKVLDLFAGTGAMGIEAISRGAKFCTFVEKNPLCLKLIRRNLELAKSEQKCSIIGADATKLPENTLITFDIVFLDPPYFRGLPVEALASAKQQNWLHKECVIVIESEGKLELEKDFEIVDERKYGSSFITISKLKTV